MWEEEEDAVGYCDGFAKDAGGERRQRVESERLRGLKIAGMYSGLDNLQGEFKDGGILRSHDSHERYASQMHNNGVYT